MLARVTFGLFLESICCSLIGFATGPCRSKTLSPGIFLVLAFFYILFLLVTDSVVFSENIITLFFYV